MKYFQILFSSIFIIATSGCDQIPCEDIDCGEHGTCNEFDGSCDCDPAYFWDETQQTCISACELALCPPNSNCSETTGDCECNPGYAPGYRTVCDPYNAKFNSTWFGSHIDQNDVTSAQYSIVFIPDTVNPFLVHITNFINLPCQNGNGQITGTIADPGLAIFSFNGNCDEFALVGDSNSVTLVSETVMVLHVEYTDQNGNPQSLDGTYFR